MKIQINSRKSVIGYVAVSLKTGKILNKIYGTASSAMRLCSWNHHGNYRIARVRITEIDKGKTKHLVIDRSDREQSYRLLTQEHPGFPGEKPDPRLT